MIRQQMELITSTDMVRNLCKKVAPPLVTLLSAEPEIQYVALRNINLIVQRRPTILVHEIKVFFCKYNDPIYVKMEKLEIMIKLASDRNIDQVLLEFKEYATEVDVDFVRKAVRAIGRCAIKLERAAERCISVLLELIKIKTKYLLYVPFSYESIIATLCESLDTLDEPEAKKELPMLMSSELLESFLESLPEEPAQVVLNNATVETDNPDLRDRAYIFWRLLSTDPEAAKDVVLAEKPVISDDSNQLDCSLLDELVADIATLFSVYHKPPDAFVTRVKIAQKTEEDDFPNGSETGYSETPSHAADSGASPPATSSNAPQAAARQPAPASPPVAVPDLLCDLIGLDNNNNSNNSIVAVNEPVVPAG
ncbi:hypothetical protein U1Q18_019285 [Sarracenia purpurea var. burkii]